MEDRYALLSTAYAWTPSAHYSIRETDDPPLTARQQLARDLRWRRVLNGWSQEALGLAAGLDRSYVGAVERMEVNISMDNAEKLARAFGLSLEGLLGTEVLGVIDQQVFSCR